MRNAGVAAIELLLVDRLLPSDSYSLASVVGDLFSGVSPLFHIMPAVDGYRFLSSESYSLVGGSVLSHRASWWLVGRLRW